MRQWFKTLWVKTRAWFVALLVAVGLMTLPAMAGPISFSWTNATENVDGTPFDAATEQMEVRIYCNGDPSPYFVAPGAQASLEVITTPGTYTCFARTVNMDNIESADSNTVTKIVLAAAPNPPVLND